MQELVKEANDSGKALKPLTIKEIHKLYQAGIKSGRKSSISEAEANLYDKYCSYTSDENMANYLKLFQQAGEPELNNKNQAEPK